MPILWIYLCCGVLYWAGALAACGEHESVRTLSRGLRARVHATAMLLSMLLWPVALPISIARGLSQ